MKTLSLVVVLLVCTFSVQGLIACDVTDIELWIGETQCDAEAHNTSTVWECAGNSFGWHVHWEADEPDIDDFQGRIYVG